MSNIRIVSGTLRGLFCTFKYEHEVQPETTDVVTIKSGLPVHEDLKAAFKALNPHLAVICEEVEANDVPDIENIPEISGEEGSVNDPIAEMLSRFAVASFTISGTGENESITLSGSKRLSTGDTVSLTTPSIELEGTQYQFVNELRIAIDNVVSEIEEYKNGKRAPIVVQTEMFAEESEEVQ